MVCKAAPTAAHRARRWSWCAFAALIGVAICLAGAIFGHDAVASYMETQLKAYAIVDNTNAGGWAKFYDSADPQGGITVYSYYYLYNITNPHDVIRGAKPIVEELPPVIYTYRQIKLNATISEDGGSITYTEYQRYFPLDDTTLEREQMQVTIPNAVLLGALNKPVVSELLPALLWKLFFFDDLQGAFVTKSARDVIWGYADDYLPASFPGLQFNDTDEAYALKQHSPCTVNTGKYSAPDTMQYEQWDGMTGMTCCENGPQGEYGSGGSCAPAWNTFDANRVYGSFGAAYHLHLDPAETLTFSTATFGLYRHWPIQCRPENAPGPGWNYDGSYMTKGLGGCDTYEIRGVPVMRFQWPEWIMGNASVSPDEAEAYGIDGPSGIMSMAQCLMGAPIVLSKPLFLDGSNELRDNIIGLPPADNAVHNTRFGIEPVTGQMVDLQFNVGINVRMRPTVDTVLSPLLNLTWFPHMRDMVVPIGRNVHNGSLTDSQAAQIQAQVYDNLRILCAMRWGNVAVGGALLITACVAAYLGHKASREAARRERGGVDGGAGDDEELGDDDGAYSLLAPSAQQQQLSKASRSSPEPRAAKVDAWMTGAGGYADTAYGRSLLANAASLN